MEFLSFWKEVLFFVFCNEGQGGLPKHLLCESRGVHWHHVVWSFCHLWPLLRHDIWLTEAWFDWSHGRTQSDLCFCKRTERDKGRGWLEDLCSWSLAVDTCSPELCKPQWSHEWGAQRQLQQWLPMLRKFIPDHKGWQKHLKVYQLNFWSKAGKISEGLNSGLDEKKWKTKWRWHNHLAFLFHFF